MLKFLSRHPLFALVAGAFAFLALAAIISYFVPLYGEVCSKNEYTGHKDCATYHISTVIFWHIGEFLNYYGGAVTAVATAFIGLFTYTLYTTSAVQARLTQKSIDLATREYVSAHRPKLLVRQMLPHFSRGLRIGVHYIVSNVGETRAHIKKIETVMRLRTASGGEFAPETTDAEPRTLLVGEHCLYLTNTTDLRYDNEWGLHNRIGGQLEFRGFIEYMDDNGTERRTGFWRVYSVDSQRFEPRDDPDYEYQD